MSTLLAIVDTETTGLDPDRHEVWEVALILRRPDGARTEHVWQLPVDLGRADAVALSIGRFYERRHKAPTPLAEFARAFAAYTHGAHLVGAVPSFDAAFLSRLLRANGACPGWHYHLVDVEALAIGWLAAKSEAGSCEPPWESNELTEALGITVDESSKHTALGDARWAEAIYDRVMCLRDSLNPRRSGWSRSVWA